MNADDLSRATAACMQDDLERDESTTTRNWPDPLRPEAFHGPAGELVEHLEPHSEADPAALLTHSLVAFGNMVGHGAHFIVGGTTHHTNLSCVNVGTTASRKGTAKDDAFFVIRPIDEVWFDNRVQSGLSSGEGLIWAVRDQIEEQQAIKEKGRVVSYEMVVTDKGVDDKRLLVVESEFGSTLRVIEREGNTLSAQIRQGWDSGDLRILTKTKAARATGAHISIIGHITREELLKYLNETEQANGFANRILWVVVRRSKLLPDGGEIQKIDLSKIRDRISKAAVFARRVGEISRSDKARELWHAVYPNLVGERLGLFGAVTNRAEAQTMRLALIYAVLDESRLIEPVHLKAGLALWAYCEASAKFIFGDSLGDRTADEVLKALQCAADGLTKTELNNHFGRNKPAADINRGLMVLLQHGLAYFKKEDGPGRSTERWFSTTGKSTK